MTGRSELSPLAAVGIWLVALIGSSVTAVAVFGAVGDSAARCDGEGSVGWWTAVLVAALVPVLVMAAVAGGRRQRWMLGLALTVAGIVIGLGFSGPWSAVIGACTSIA